MAVASFLQPEKKLLILLQLCLQCLLLQHDVLQLALELALFVRHGADIGVDLLLLPVCLVSPGRPQRLQLIVGELDVGILLLLLLLQLFYGSLIAGNFALHGVDAVSRIGTIC